MRKFAYMLNLDLLFESKNALLIKAIKISRLTLHMQQVEDKKRKHVEFVDR